MKLSLRLALILSSVLLSVASCSGPRSTVTVETASVSLRESPSHYVELNGARIHYIEEGAGSPVILLHGVLGNANIWSRNIGALAREHRVIALEFPGFGQSTLGNYPITVESYSRFLRDFMEALQIPRASLIGISLGGNVALLFALRHPEQVEKLILISPTGIKKPPGLPTEMLYGILWHEPVLENHLTVKKFKKIWDEQFRLDPAYRDALYARRTDLHTKQGIKKFIPVFKSIIYDIEHHTLRGKLQNIEVPTLLVWGTYEPYHPPRDGNYMLDHMKNAHMLTVQCGHNVMGELPDWFNKASLEFLKSNGDKTIQSLKGGSLEKTE